jgi:hypothetical protein
MVVRRAFKRNRNQISMRILLPVLSLAALAACQPPVPNDAGGAVGFGSYSDYQAQREAQLAAERNRQIQTVQGPVLPSAIPYGPAQGAPSASELAQAGIGAGQLSATEPLTAIPSATAPIGSPAIPEPSAVVPDPSTQTAVATAQPGLEAHTGISDEQDFAAVASRETIESDKQRMEQNKAQYQQIQPTELPERTAAADASVDLVQYALNAPNRKGETIYPRSRIAISNSDRNCARYDTPEAAQQAFLKAGGPQRDSKNLDPDGDGFACYWDPTPFQKAKQ